MCSMTMSIRFHGTSLLLLRSPLFRFNCGSHRRWSVSPVVSLLSHTHIYSAVQISTITTSAASLGSYVWAVNSTVASKCYIVIADVNKPDLVYGTSAPFSIANVNWQVTQPILNSVLYSEFNYTLSWTCQRASTSLVSSSIVFSPHSNVRVCVFSG